MRDVMLTTIDNPYDPFDDYERWYAYDTRVGHNTAGYLARIALVSDDMSDGDVDFAIELAIDEIVKENINGLYKKVSKEIST